MKISGRKVTAFFINIIPAWTLIIVLACFQRWMEFCIALLAFISTITGIFVGVNAYEKYVRSKNFISELQEKKSDSP